MNADQITQALDVISKLLENKKLLSKDTVETINMTIMELLCGYPTTDPLNEAMVRAVLK